MLPILALGISSSCRGGGCAAPAAAAAISCGPAPPALLGAACGAPGPVAAGVEGGGSGGDGGGGAGDGAGAETSPAQGPESGMSASPLTARRTWPLAAAEACSAPPARRTRWRTGRRSCSWGPEKGRRRSKRLGQLSKALDVTKIM